MKRIAFSVLTLLGILCFLGNVFYHMKDTSGLHYYPRKYSDMYEYFEPALAFMKRSVSDGSFPLWNPHQAGGHPFFANIQFAMLYPNTWVMLFADVPSALLLIQFLNISIGMLGMLIYMRYLKIGWPGVVLAVVIFGCATLRESFNLCGGSTYCWIPIIFWLTQRLFDRPTLRNGVFLAGALALSFFGGWPQYFYYICLLVSVYFFIQVILASPWSDPGKAMRRLGLFIFSFVVVAGLVSVQLLPTLEFSSNAVRSFQDNVSQYSRRRLGFGYLKNHAQRIQSHFFFARSSAIFVPFGLAFRRTRTVAVALLGALAYSILFVLSKEISFLSVFGNLPFVDSFRYPLRMYRLFPFVSSVLSGVGISYVPRLMAPFRLRNSETGKIEPLWIFAAGFCAIVLFPVFRQVLELIKSSSAYFIIVLPVLSIILLMKIQFFDLSRRKKNLGSLMVLAAALTGILMHWNIFYYGIPYVILSLLILLLYIVFRHASRLSLGQKNIMVWGIIVLLLFGIPCKTYLGLIPFTADQNQRTEKNDWAGCLSEYDRVFLTGESPTLASIFGFYSISDYETFTLQRFNNYVKMMVGTERFESRLSDKLLTGLFNGRLQRFPEIARYAPLLGVGSLRYLITPGPLEEDVLEEGWTLMFEVEGESSMFYIYENRHALPRTYLVHDYILSHSEKESLEAVRKNVFTLEHLVVLENGVPSFPRSGKTKEVGWSRIEKYGPNEVQICVNALAPALLILTDNYYPGWVAYVDDAAKPIWRANSLYRAVEVTPGTQVVTFKYEPPLFRKGIVISLTTLGLVLAGCLIWRDCARLPIPALRRPSHKPRSEGG